MTKLDLQRQVALVEDAIMSSYSHMHEAAIKGDYDKTNSYIYVINALTNKLYELTGTSPPEHQTYKDEEKRSCSPSSLSGYNISNLGPITSQLSTSSPKPSKSRKKPSSSKRKSK